MDVTWKAALGPEFKAPYFRQLATWVEARRKTHTVLPPAGEVFNAFRLPLPDVKVVILGQDPYPSLSCAHGLAFSIRPSLKLLPDSLVNIFRELKADVGAEPPGHGCLTAWAEQGVLLLNTTLTVDAGLPGTHIGQGWETFTDAVIRALSDRPEPLVFLLWGKHAQSKQALIDSRHAVFTAAHPSPRSADHGFFGSRPFSKANGALVGSGQTPIVWQLPPRA